MSYRFALSPDFNAREIPSWFIFNTRLQQLTGQALRMEMFESFGALRQAIHDDSVDLVYANAFDAALLVRQKGFVPVAQPADNPDEALVVVSAESEVRGIVDLRPGLRIAATEAPDVEMIGRILIEPADLDRENSTLAYQKSYILVAKALLNGTADTGFFLKRSFDQLSNSTRRGLRPIADSHIYVVRHGLLAGPRLAAQRDEILAAVRSMNVEAKDRALLEELGFQGGWQELTREDAEFMIDLMETLVR